MPTRRTAKSPIIRSYLKRRALVWSTHHNNIAVGILDRWTAWLGARGRHVVDATGDDCADFLAARVATVAGSTAHKDYQHLVWLYSWLVDEGEIEAPLDAKGRPKPLPERGPMHRIAAPEVNDPDPARVAAISAADYAALMATFSKRRLDDTRNAALCSLMYWSGMRRSEVTRCDLERYDAAAGELEVLGKNGQWRTVPLTMETQILLDRYLRRRGDDPSPALFASTRYDESDGRLQPGAIGLMLKRRRDRLGLTFSAHQFRRAMSIHSAERGIPAADICTIAGWEDPRMLERYQRTGKARLAAASFRAADPTATRAQRARRPRTLRAVG